MENIDHAARRREKALNVAQATLLDIQDRRQGACAQAKYVRNDESAEFYWKDATGIWRGIMVYGSVGSDAASVYANMWLDDSGRNGLRLLATLKFGQASAAVIGYLPKLIWKAYEALTAIDTIQALRISDGELNSLRKLQ
ncbi:MAG: hypothetical protein Q8Q39_03155 [bacterium]|nr:hypothetical protein [bacterium]